MQGHSITPLDALDMFGCFRLSGRIYELKAEGHNIKMEMVTQNGKKFASYKLLTNGGINGNYNKGEKCIKNLS